METAEKNKITIETIVNAPVEKTWKHFSEPASIVKWCFASDDWHAPEAENDLRTGGKFKTKMAAKDGSYAFDFEGVYSRVEPLKTIEYELGDARKVTISFSQEGNGTRVTETFDAESQHSPEMQRAGWQSILDNFKKYVESV
jgi:uncharacterized protein YndB with AHSA1/START domain